MRISQFFKNLPCKNKKIESKRVKNKQFMSNLRNLFQNVEKAKIDYYWQLIRAVVTGPERERVAFLDKVKKTEPE